MNIIEKYKFYFKRFWDNFFRSATGTKTSQILIFLIFIFGWNTIKAQDRITGKPFATRSEVIAVNGMAATSHPLATQVAIDILKKGGNAIDASIAANAVIGLMEPTGNGIGGDLFAIIWDAKTQKLYGIDASGYSPKSLTLEWFQKNNLKSIPAYGPLPVTVPGCVAGWSEMHKKYGKLKWKNLFEPVIAYAREGFPVSELVAYYLKQSATNLSKYPGYKETYLVNGKSPEKGDVFKNPDLANTFEKIAAGGSDAFYKGDMAKTMASFIQQQGGFLSYEDLSEYKPEWVNPVSTNYRGYDVWEIPPAGQGIAALQMLNILEAYDIKSMGFGSKEYVHLFVEAKKLVYEDRAKYYADMQFSKVPVEKLISKDYAHERRKLIRPDRAGRNFDAGELEQGNTIYLTVADKEGNMVSLIQSNYRGMGSGMIPNGLGFMLQDRGELFSLEPGHKNVYEPRKRPFHTIIPGFVTKDGKPYISFGVMGGAMQPQGHVQVLINMIDFGMNLQEAGDAPRIQHIGSSEPTGEKMTDGGWVELEEGFDYETIRELMKMGHRVKWGFGGYGGYQAILYCPVRKVYFGASESRKDGQAAGY
jgi:gamma-glutamyltranspeptidase / glutathione hydrolase